MQYAINKTNYHDFSVISKNRLENRSYFIPFPDRTAADVAELLTKRYSSPLVTCLNGDWDFKFYPIPKEVPDTLDTEKVRWDTMPVPGCWQYHGIDRPFYLNCRYQFDYKPPVIPTTDPVTKVFSLYDVTDHGVRLFNINRPKAPEYNFTGIYRKLLLVSEMTGRYVITFLGVATGLDLYCNGSFVGYSESSFNPAEFDLTPFLKAGENELVCVVRRWCTGTYLECQDMFRSNGIFRDVLLYHMGEASLWDVKTVTEKAADGTYSLKCSVKGPEGLEVRMSLTGHGIEQSGSAAIEKGGAEVQFSGLAVTEWNAEDPVLYDVYFETAGECIRLRRGFMDVKIDGRKFLVNGKPVKFRGVNHHDSTADKGYTMTPEEILRDVLRCKEFNVDTVRTSHYPPDPLFLELCCEYGLYTVLEGNLETHGVQNQAFPPNFNRLSDNPKWMQHYVDRAERLYERDKNNTSTILWSLGNESGAGCNTDAMYAYLKGVTPIPVHYESAIHSKIKAYDVGSEMYPTPKRVEEVGLGIAKTKKLNDRPYFLCEYAHAMGVGPGGIEDYWKAIYDHESLMGGCIWEMNDHAVLHSDGSYTYGGDHGEFIHDRNFCVDGLFYPDRTPSTGARIMAFTYRPIRVRALGGTDYELFYTKTFAKSSRYTLRFTADTGAERTMIPEVQPLCRVTVTLPELAGAALVLIETLEDGRVIAREQLQLQKPALPAPAVLSGGCDGVEDRGLYRDGSLEGGDTCLFRAPTDNDNTIIPSGGIDFTKAEETVLGVERAENKTVVRRLITAKGFKAEVTDTCEPVENGALITSRYHCLKGRGDLPRFSKVFRLPASFDRVEYFGRDDETYGDMRDHGVIRKVSCAVKDMTEPNIKPQESGNRMDTEWVRLSDGQTAYRFTAVETPFELGVKPYSDKELLSMRHREDEKTTGTYVTIQAFQKGIGTGACGPATAKEFCYPVKADYELKFTITKE